MPNPRKTATAPAAVARLKPGYDVVVQGGRVIDPANGIDAVHDIGIKKGRIAALAP
jgi:adenine deaminase